MRASAVIRFTLQQIAEAAKSRPAGYEADVIASGIIDGDAVLLTTEAYLSLRAKYHRGFGLGDAVAAIAQPIAGVLDRVLGTNIKRCGACTKRREALNRIRLG